MKLYLTFVNGIIKAKEITRERIASAKAEEEEMLEEMEKSIKENTNEDDEAAEEVGDGAEVDMEEDSIEVRVDSLESGYGSGKVKVAQQTSL